MRGDLGSLTLAVPGTNARPLQPAMPPEGKSLPLLAPNETAQLNRQVVTRLGWRQRLNHCRRQGRPNLARRGQPILWALGQQFKNDRVKRRRQIGTMGAGWHDRRVKVLGGP